MTPKKSKMSIRGNYCNMVSAVPSVRFPSDRHVIVGMPLLSVECQGVECSTAMIIICMRGLMDGETAARFKSLL